MSPEVSSVPFSLSVTLKCVHVCVYLCVCEMTEVKTPAATSEHGKGVLSMHM